MFDLLALKNNSSIEESRYRHRKRRWLRLRFSGRARTLTNSGNYMYDIVATVTTATPTELRLMGHWPLRWWQARCAKFTKIQRRLSPNETLPAPQEPVIEEETSGDRGQWQDLEAGDRVIVRVFWPGEIEIARSEEQIQATTNVQTQPSKNGKAIRVN